ncbi:MAG: hypothetical protein ABW136_09200 [Steroidobacteraceae bacterium]
MARKPELIEESQADLEARENLAADALPELDAASDDEELELALESHATEEIVGDSDGDDYRAGTLDPEGSDRGPWQELTGDHLDGDSARR